MDELVKDILDAYKINTDSMDPFSNRADKTIDKVYAKVEELFSKLGNFSMNEIFHILFDAIVLVLILLIGKVIVVDILCQFLLSMIFSFFVGFYMITDFMLSLCRILYLCLAIYFFVKVMAKRVERYRLHAHNVGVMDDIKDTWNDNIKSSDLPPTPERPLYHERKPRHLESDVLKVILVLAMIPVACVLIGSGIGLVVLIYVTIVYATTSAGLYCMDIAFVLGSLAILLMLVRAWPKRVDTNAQVRCIVGCFNLIICVWLWNFCI